MEKSNKTKVDISIIFPVYNEKDNLNDLYNCTIEILNSNTISYELIFVDDGSNDGSHVILEDLSKNNKNVKVVRFRKNFGQTAAMTAGINYSIGDVIVFMDSDLQNDPSDIPLLLTKLKDGFDVVSGWRKNRKDNFTKKIPSFIANIIISKLTRVKIHDLGCTLKAYRREIIEEINIYGEMHRFLPVLAAGIGANITEIEVKHLPRTRGKSKYGLMRTFKVLLDLMTVQFMGIYGTKPIYLYGLFAFFCFIFSAISGFLVIFMKVFWTTDMTGNPFLLLTVLFILITIILLLLGIQSEIISRIYHQSGKVKQYHIKETHNI